MNAWMLDRWIRRLELLAGVSDDPSMLVRTLLSPANLRAAVTISEWMEEAGLVVEHTIDGSIRGILPGDNPGAKPLLIGSHFDTVINAGAYDGPLGILSAIAAVECLREEGCTLPFPVHILGFSDEEGVRFHGTYIGSKGMTCGLDRGLLDCEDRQGIRLSQALSEEGWREGVSEVRYAPGDARGYIELHIEQGRVLEEMNLPASGVSSLAGQTRLRVRIDGQADHAGTTPMGLRRDALTGAAACILALEELAAAHPPGVATVGQIEVLPGAANAIPQSATFSVDIRHPDDATRIAMRGRAETAFAEICKARSLELTCRQVLDDNATPCDACLSEQLLDSVESVCGQRTSLVSGAGHDAVALASIMPVAMVFVRCRAGLSHHPDEFASPDDIAAGIDILTDFLRRQAELAHPAHA